MSEYPLRTVLRPGVLPETAALASTIGAVGWQLGTAPSLDVVGAGGVALAGATTLVDRRAREVLGL